MHPSGPWLASPKSRNREFQRRPKSMFTRFNIFRNRIKGDGNESRNEHWPGLQQKGEDSQGSDPTRVYEFRFR